MTGLSRSARRCRDALLARGHEIDVACLSDSTRTAPQAADTIGYAIGGVTPENLPETAGAGWCDVAG